MKINHLTPTSDILGELGKRLALIRKQKGFTQASLASEAGIGIATLKRIEGGQDSQMETWLKILTAIDMVFAINSVLPENYQSPMAEAKAQTKRSRKNKKRSATRGWGDESI